MPKQIDWALNPLQFMATPSGWLDPAAAPAPEIQYRIIAEAGFVRIQPPAPVGPAADFAKELAEFGLAAGPGYHSLGTGADPCEITPELTEELAAAACATAVYCAELGVSDLFLGPGLEPGILRTETAARGEGASPERLERYRDLVGTVAARMVAETGIRPALHPHVGSWVETEHETRFVLDTVDPAVLSFGPDVGHLRWAGAAVEQLLADYADRITAVHVKDYDAAVADRARAEGLGLAEAVRAGIWREPGYGDADLDGMLGLLPGDWTGAVVVEVDHPAAPTVEESIARCGRWVAERR